MIANKAEKIPDQEKQIIWETMASQAQMLLSWADYNFFQLKKGNKDEKLELWLAGNENRQLVIAGRMQVGSICFAEGACIGYSQNWVSVQRRGRDRTQVTFPFIEQLLRFGSSMVVEPLLMENVAFQYMNVFTLGEKTLQRIAPLDLHRRQVLRASGEEMTAIKAVRDGIYQARFCMMRF